jgi:hypothetical protein
MPVLAIERADRQLRDLGLRHEAYPARSSGFAVRRWQPEPSWRAVFLGWIAERQRQGREWVQRVLSWIDKLDPAGDLFTTPGAVLPLLRFIWTDNPRSPRPEGFVEDWLASNLGRAAGDLQHVHGGFGPVPRREARRPDRAIALHP